MWKQWSHTKLPWRSHHHNDVSGDPRPDRIPSRRRQRASSARASRTSSQELYSGACWLEALPADVLAAVLACLDHASLHAFELTSRFCVTTIHSCDFWKRSIAKQLVCYDGNRTDARGAALWKRMHCMKQQRAGFSSDALLTGVLACDSPNDFSVPPTWLLFKSRCWFWMEKLLNKTTPDRESALLYVRQLHCGCGYHVPCFWSSGGSRSPDTRSSIDFSVRAHCFLTQIQFVPYQAFWLDGHPAFAPQRVSFTLLHQEGEELVAFYESPDVAVTNEMTLHAIDLPKTVWTAHATVLRVNLLGRTQRGPLDERPWIARQTDPVHDASGAEDHLPDYYCCLSYINAVGFVVQDDSAKKGRRWWHH